LIEAGKIYREEEEEERKSWETLEVYIGFPRPLTA
jgi:hypothetical protein